MSDLYIRTLAKSAVCFVGLLVSSFNVQAHSNQTITESVRVYGQAAISVEPDQAVLSFQVVKKGRSVVKLKAFVDQQTEQIVNQLAKYDINRADIQTSQTMITPIFKDNSELIGAEVRSGRTKAYVALDDEPNDEIEGFRIARSITVVVKDLGQYDKVIDTVLRLGVNQLNNTSYRYSKSEETYQQALALAVNNAKLKALQLAKVSERKLGKIINIDERSNAPVMALEAAPSFRSNYRSEHGSQNINARVEVQFIFD